MDHHIRHIRHLVQIRLLLNDWKQRTTRLQCLFQTSAADIRHTFESLILLLAFLAICTRYYSLIVEVRKVHAIELVDRGLVVKAPNRHPIIRSLIRYHYALLSGLR